MDLYIYFIYENNFLGKINCFSDLFNYFFCMIFLNEKSVYIVKFYWVVVFIYIKFFLLIFFNVFFKIIFLLVRG